MRRLIQSTRSTPPFESVHQGPTEAMGLEENSAYGNGLSIGVQFSQQMLPQFNDMLFGGDSTKSVNKDQVLAGIISA